MYRGTLTPRYRTVIEICAGIEGQVSRYKLGMSIRSKEEASK